MKVSNRKKKMFKRATAFFLSLLLSVNFVLMDVQEAMAATGTVYQADPSGTESGVSGTGTLGTWKTREIVSYEKVWIEPHEETRSIYTKWMEPETQSYYVDGHYEKKYVDVTRSYTIPEHEIKKQEWVPPTTRTWYEVIPEHQESRRKVIPAHDEEVSYYVDGHYETVPVPAHYETEHVTVPGYYTTETVPATTRTEQVWVAGYTATKQVWVPAKTVTKTKTVAGHYETRNGKKTWIPTHTESYGVTTPGHYETQSYYVAGHNETRTVTVPATTKQVYHPSYSYDRQYYVPASTKQEWIPGHTEKKTIHVEETYETEFITVPEKHIPHTETVEGYYRDIWETVPAETVTVTETELQDVWVNGYYATKTVMVEKTGYKTTTINREGYFTVQKKVTTESYFEPAPVEEKEKGLLQKAGAWLIDKYEEATDKVEEIKENIGNAAQTVTNAVATVAKEKMPAVYDAYVNAVEKVSETVDSVRKTFNEAKNTAFKVYEELTDAISKGIDYVAEKGAELVEKAKTSINNAITTVKTFATEAKEKVVNLYEEVKETATNVKNYIVDTANEVWEDVKEDFKQSYELTTHAITKIGATLAEVLPGDNFVTEWTGAISAARLPFCRHKILMRIRS